MADQEIILVAGSDSEVIVGSPATQEFIVDAALIGPPGAQGQNGLNGFGVAAGGVVGQYLGKTSSADYATAFMTIPKADVGLGNVDNTSDVNKPISTLTQAAIDLLAPKASPALTGTPTTPTATANTNNTQIASTAYADASAAAAAPDATTSVKGKVKLSGDITGSATSVKVKSRTVLTVGDSNSDYPVANYSTFSHAVNQAVTDMVSAGVHGEVKIQAGTFQVPASGSVTITPADKITIRGSGIGKTIIQSLRTDYVFKSTTGVTDFSVQDMTIDCQSATNVNAIEMLNSTRFVCRNVQFINSAQWFMKLGSEPSSTSTNYCYDCVVDHCVFDTHSSIYEMLLIYNAKNTVVKDCTFKNGAASSPTVGLWQKTDNTRIIRCNFQDCAYTAIYYAITCNNTWVENCLFDNCATGVLGGNVPDNGLFGTTYLFNLHVNRNYFKGGANSTSSAAVQFGAVDGCYAQGNIVEAYQRGFIFTYGNTTGAITAPYASKNGIINGNVFKNINPVGTNPTIENALLFANGSGSGMLFSDNKVIDDQGTPTNIYPVSFNTTGATYSNMKFIDNDFPVGPSGASIKVNDTATVDATVLFENTHNLTNPTGGILGNSIKSMKGLYIRDGVLGVSSGETINSNTDLQIGNGSAVTTFRQNNVQEKNSNDNMQRIWPNFTGKTEIIYKNNTNSGSRRSILDIDTGVHTANGFDANLATDVTTGGIVVKRLTTTQRDAIASPQTGTIIWNTTTAQFEQYNGSAWAALVTGGGGGGLGYVLPASSNTSTPADATTYYFGDVYVLSLQTSADIQRLYIPVAGTITAVGVTFHQTAGSNETSTVYLRKNNTTDTTISSSVTNDATNTRVLATGLSISVANTDYVELKWTTPTWATNPTNVRVTAKIYIS